ncbi:hypothetical protein GGR55DRAFT_659129 [Xylaria sp. FL0064]|nr:hypothetical protein GGR55DRAFT_659129 [Xylaria sp. FL0064]
MGRSLRWERGSTCTESSHRFGGTCAFNRTLHSASQHQGSPCAGQSCLIPASSANQIATDQLCSVGPRSLKLAESSFPNIAPRTSFHGPIDTTTIRLKAGALTTYQLKCCGFVQCRTYLTPPRDSDTPFKGGQTFHILAYMPHDQQPWRSRIEWMKNAAEGGFVSRKWMYGRGSIVGVLNDALLEEEPPAGHDILVVLVDEFGFTSKASFDVGSGSGMGVSPRKAGAAARNPFSHSPIGSPRKQPTKPASPSVPPARTGKGKGTAVEDESLESATLFSSPANLEVRAWPGPRRSDKRHHTRRQMFPG